MIKFFSLLFFLSFTYKISAQTSELGNWMMYFGNQSITKKLNWHNEIQYRNYNTIGDLEQLLIRTGLGYDLTEKNNNVLFGLAYIKSEDYFLNASSEKIENEELRIFQQFITKQHFSRIYLQHRYRIEERFIENNFKMRFRYFLGLNIPFTSKKMEKGEFYFSAYNEVFVQNESNAFDRNRYYGAIGFLLENNFRIELGYMNQQFGLRSRDQFQIAIFNSLPFFRN
tara:strand:+ start:8557 stop:9234 length:678 start_codon:yes stop_codon:yes gene_type:complete